MSDLLKTYTFEERHPTTPGPWADEPDKAQWIDEATDLDCLIVRNMLGALCGYVGVPPGHPWHGVEYDVPDVEVHGGLTFSDSCQEGAEDGPGICHVPQPGRPAEVWWLGFDCAHAFDLQPRQADLLAESSKALGLTWTYRTFDYVRDECRALARQVAAAGK
jgi:hypothetical protein